MIMPACCRWIWISVGALVIAIGVFHVIILLAVKFLGPYGRPSPSISEEGIKERAYSLHGQKGLADQGITVDIDEEITRSRKIRSQRNMALAQAGQSMRRRTSEQGSRKSLGSGASRKVMDGGASQKELPANTGSLKQLPEEGVGPISQLDLCSSASTRSATASHVPAWILIGILWSLQVLASLSEAYVIP